jgi:DNA-binding MarR family transcriptional regulator
MTLRLEGGAEQSLFPSQIAEHLLLNRNRVTKIMDSLMTRRLVERFEYRANRRHIVVRLSKQGGKMLDAAFATYQEGLRELLSSLDEAQHESVIAGLRLVLLGVQERAKPDFGCPDVAAY